MGLFNRGRNVGNNPSPDSNVGVDSDVKTDNTIAANIPGSIASKSSRQVPEDERLERTIIVPQTPVEIALVLSALGAEPGPSAFRQNDHDIHYRVFTLPETMSCSSTRYSRVDEYNDGSNPIHGWVPGTIWAPDNTLLFNINNLSGLKVSLGKTWSTTASLLIEQQGSLLLPEEVIFVGGIQSHLPHGELFTKYINGIEQEGLFQVADAVKRELAKVLGQILGSDDLNSKCETYVGKFKTLLGDVDHLRAQALREFINTMEENIDQNIEPGNPSAVLPGSVSNPNLPAVKTADVDPPQTGLVAEL